MLHHLAGAIIQVTNLVIYNCHPIKDSNTVVIIYSKTCLKRLFKIDKPNIFMTNGSLMKVKSIAECSPWSILQYF